MLLFGYGKTNTSSTRSWFAGDRRARATGVLATTARRLPTWTNGKYAWPAVSAAARHRILTEQPPHQVARVAGCRLGQPRGRPPPPVSAPASSVIRTPVPMAAAAARAPELAPRPVRVQRLDTATQASLWTRLRRGLFAAGQAAAREMNQSNVGLLEKERHS